MKKKDVNWLNDKIEDIRKRKRSLKNLIDPDIIKQEKKNLKRERRSVKRAERNFSKKEIKKEIEKHEKLSKDNPSK